MITREFINQEFLRKPVVTITIEEFAPKFLTVLGEVNRPGKIDIQAGANGIPIQVAVAQAGGFKNTAKTTEVTVRRASGGSNAAPTPVNVDSLLRHRVVRGSFSARGMSSLSRVAFFRGLAGDRIYAKTLLRTRSPRLRRVAHSVSAI